MGESWPILAERMPGCQKVTDAAVSYNLDRYKCSNTTTDLVSCPQLQNLKKFCVELQTINRRGCTITEGLLLVEAHRGLLLIVKTDCETDGSFPALDLCLATVSADGAAAWHLLLHSDKREIQFGFLVPSEPELLILTSPGWTRWIECLLGIGRVTLALHKTFSL